LEEVVAAVADFEMAAAKASEFSGGALKIVG
jgi:hypothetical protein